MRLRVGCEFQFESDYPVAAVMLVRARADGEHHTLHESQWAEPDLPIHEYRDGFGNACWRLTFPGGPATVRYDAVVEVDPEPDVTVPNARLAMPGELPDEVLSFTLPSRYVQSDLLANDAWTLFGNTAPTWERVQAICDWVHENIRYQAGVSGPDVTALDVFQRRVGVCRDFALIVIAFCRAMNIPARYTCGYLPDIAIDAPDTPMDFHAWCEVFIGDRWYTFDARHNMPRIGRVVVGYGRDAVDVAMTTSYGPLRLVQMTVWADEIPVDAAVEGGPSLLRLAGQAGQPDAVA